MRNGCALVPASDLPGRKHAVAKQMGVIELLAGDVAPCLQAQDLTAADENRFMLSKIQMTAAHPLL